MYYLKGQRHKTRIARAPVRENAHTCTNCNLKAKRCAEKEIAPSWLDMY